MNQSEQEHSKPLLEPMTQAAAAPSKLTRLKNHWLARRRFVMAGGHFTISLLILLGVLALMYFVLYPVPFFGLVGIPILMVLLTVDVVMGPVLCFAAAAPLKSKRELTMDLLVIVVLQLAALGYGVHKLIEGRPVHTVFVKDRMELVRASEVSTDPKFASVLPEFQRLPLSFQGVAIAAEIPTDIEELNEMTFLGVGGMDYQHVPKYYRAFESQKTAILAHAKPVAKALPKMTEADQATLTRLLQEHAFSLDTALILPILYQGESRLIFVFDADQMSHQAIGLLEGDFYDVFLSLINQ